MWPHPVKKWAPNQNLRAEFKTDTGLIHFIKNRIAKAQISLRHEHMKRKPKKEIQITAFVARAWSEWKHELHEFAVTINFQSRIGIGIGDDCLSFPMMQMIVPVSPKSRRNKKRHQAEKSDQILQFAITNHAPVQKLMGEKAESAKKCPDQQTQSGFGKKGQIQQSQGCKWKSDDQNKADKPEKSGDFGFKNRVRKLAAQMLRVKANTPQVRFRFGNFDDLSGFKC